jgi:CHASE3 domain sensor protein
MSIVEQIKSNLIDLDKHGPILQALAEILEERGEKGVRDQIKKWVEEIEEEAQQVGQLSAQTQEGESK